MTEYGTLQTIDGTNIVTFERLLPHPIEIVWAAITEPSHLDHWFPTTIEGDRAAGAHVEFKFRDAANAAWNFEGTITVFDPPRTFALRWGPEEIRFELTPIDGGTRLVFTTAFDEPAIVARDSSGWHVCVGSLVAHLRGEAVEAPGSEMTPELDGLFEHYKEAFGDKFAAVSGMD
jgi:uncharacterized protein YndB with AHSA1/START domain